ncbi:type VI secretion system tube protein Hcp, partial [Pseudomonas otitidis]
MVFEVQDLVAQHGLLGRGRSGRGGGAGKVSVQDLSLTKYIDKSSPNLMMACSNGKHFPE